MGYNFTSEFKRWYGACFYKEQFVISLYNPIYFKLMNYSMTNIPEKHHSQIK